MNKTDRMLAIVLELQGRGRLRAEDLAATFETSVRTIYRDIQALCEAGVPVVGAPGQGYWLTEGYFLPPVSFTADEAVASLLGADFVARKFDSSYASGARNAGRKLEAVLPAAVRGEAERARAAIRLLADREDSETDEAGRKTLEALRGAVLDGRKVRFRYAKRWAGPDGSRVNERTAAPYGLVLTNGVWMLVAFCELRGELRHFRLDRMAELAVLDDRFVLPDGFDLRTYAPADDRRLLVRLRFGAGMEERLRETGGYYLESTTRLDGGELEAIFRMRRWEELLPWILGWGGDAVVLEPEELRERVRQEAARMLERY